MELPLIAESNEREWNGSSITIPQNGSSIQERMEWKFHIDMRTYQVTCELVICEKLSFHFAVATQ